MVSVETIMTLDPITLFTTDTMGMAHRLMNEKHIHHIPIVDEQHTLLGLISHRDILAASSSTLNVHPTDNSKTLLSDIMISPVVSIPPETGTLKAAQYIHDSRHGCLPVVDQGALIGIITEYDFVEVAINLLERRSVKAYEDQSDDLTDYNANDTPEDLGIDVSAAKNWD